MKNISMTRYTDDIVKQCHQNKHKNHTTLWISLIDGHVKTPEDFKNSKYYQRLVELVANQVDKLGTEEIDSLWKQSDIAADYIYPFCAPPNHDYASYPGNKLKDIISQILDLIVVDVICYSGIQNRVNQSNGNESNMPIQGTS
jgi:hypothetical protein